MIDYLKSDINNLIKDNVFVNNKDLNSTQQHAYK